MIFDKIKVYTYYMYLVWHEYIYCGSMNIVKFESYTEDRNLIFHAVFNYCRMIKIYISEKLK